MSESNRKLTVIYPWKQTDENGAKRRVAAYCRVSTQAEEQSHSLAAQVCYYTKLIEEDESSELVDIYADRGTSGTRTHNRTNFLRMIEDCRAGKIDSVICKSVSRFGRNTVDTLVFTRELKALGIDVFFEKENLHTCSAEGELLLTLMAAVAESEAVSMSDNIKWGKRHRYEKGLVDSIVIGTILGFNQENGVISIAEDEAATVRMIYDMFLAGHGYQTICDYLVENGIPSKRPGAKWGNKTVSDVLENEKYCGDCRFQKTFISDPVSHKRVRNCGELPQFIVEDVLPSIITREQWLVAQELRKRHSSPIGYKQSENHPFTSMLVCPYCGSLYNSYASHGPNRVLMYYYRCKSHKNRTAVDVPGAVYIPPSRLRLKSPSPEMVVYREKYGRPESARQMICSDIKIPVEQPKKGFIQAWNLIVGKKGRYQATLQRTADNAENPLVRYRAKEMIGLLDTVGRITEFDYPLMLRTLDFVEVRDQDKLSYVFQCGIRITV